MEHDMYYTLNIGYTFHKNAKAMLAIDFGTFQELEKIKSVLLENDSKNGYISSLPVWVAEFKKRKITCRAIINGDKSSPYYWATYITKGVYNKLFKWYGEEKYRERLEVQPFEVND